MEPLPHYPVLSNELAKFNKCTSSLSALIGLLLASYQCTHIHNFFSDVTDYHSNGMQLRPLLNLMVLSVQVSLSGSGVIFGESMFIVIYQRSTKLTS